MNPFCHPATLNTSECQGGTLSAAVEERWPSLPWNEWEPTATTLHMWTQIVGKTRLALVPLQAHWWNVALYVSPRALTTAAMPTPHGNLEIEFDFIEHQLRFGLSDGRDHLLALRPQTVA